jgi:hypothetical protein
MRLRTVLISALVLVVSFGGATLALQWLTPGSMADKRPVVAAPPPLPPMTRTSVIVAPTAIAFTAIRDALEREAPRNFTGKRDNPVSQLLQNGEIGWTATRAPLNVVGKPPDQLGVSTVINGTLRATGQISTQAAGGLGNVLGGVLGRDVGRGVEQLAGRTLDQRADIRGTVAVASKPAILPNWRIEPNLTVQVAVGDSALSIAGVRLNVSNEVRPLLERSVNEHVGAVAARLRNDPFLEVAARREWAKMCRSIPLGTAGAGMPKLWLEVKPVRAFGAQPRVDAAAVILTLGVEAETRIVPNETKPDCPFPATLAIVPQAEAGRVAVAVPIDVPFTEVNRMISAQLTGKTFSTDKGSPFEATVRSAKLAPSGDRLLISLGVTATEKKSWFGLASEATVHVWGRPVLDRERQMLRLSDIAVDVESEAAFGLIGAAARAAAPYLEAAIAENAAIDLKPFAANARRSVEAALADFRGGGEGVRVDAAITDLRLVDIAFDATTLRVIAEADGTAQVSVTSLPAKP